MPKFEFTVTLEGGGNTQEEAWQDAVDSFCADPGEPHDEVLILDEE